MLCYRDRTFCSSDCTNTACYRHLRAKELNLLIAYSDFSPTCPDYKEPPS